jgi:hypothetical protein
MESSELFEWLGQCLSLLVLLLLFILLIVVDGLCLDLKDAKDTSLSSHDEAIIVLRVMDVRNVFLDITFTNLDVEIKILLDLI